jgi:hypothetical protein
LWIFLKKLPFSWLWRRVFTLTEFKTIFSYSYSLLGQKMPAPFWSWQLETIEESTKFEKVRCIWTTPPNKNVYIYWIYRFLRQKIKKFTFQKKIPYWRRSWKKRCDFQISNFYCFPSVNYEFDYSFRKVSNSCVILL